MDIFEKCFAPSLAGDLKEKGVYPYFHALQSRQDVEVQMEGKMCIRDRYWLGLAAITAALLVLDRRALLGVDWGLLVTFAAFFTFSLSH